MLCLTRKLDESIMIGDDVEIVMLEVKHDRVKLGVTAPIGIAVHRKEVWLKVKESVCQRSDGSA